MPSMLLLYGGIGALALHLYSPAMKDADFPDSWLRGRRSPGAFLAAP